VTGGLGACWFIIDDKCRQRASFLSIEQGPQANLKAPSSEFRAAERNCNQHVQVDRYQQPPRTRPIASASATVFQTQMVWREAARATTCGNRICRLNIGCCKLRGRRRAIPPGRQVGICPCGECWGDALCEASLKAWSQNLGHEHVPTTFCGTHKTAHK